MLELVDVVDPTLVLVSRVRVLYRIIRFMLYFISECWNRLCSMEVGGQDDSPDGAFDAG